MSQLTRDGRLLVVQTEAGVLRQNGATLTDEWHGDADAYVDGTITLDAWRARNAARSAPTDPPVCNEVCLFGDDIGMPEYASSLYQADPECPVHGGGQ